MEVTDGEERKGGREEARTAATQRSSKEKKQQTIARNSGQSPLMKAPDFVASFTAISCALVHKFMRSTLLIATPLFLAAFAQAQHAPAPKVELLWPNGAPGALGNEDTDKPNLTIYLPRTNGEHSGVVVCPGGGYQMLAVDHEGKQIAEWLNARGVAAFVLRYRLGPRYHHPIELGDAQRALRFVRFHAGDYGVETGKIGIWGFSAGGHLASTAGTHFDAGQPPSTPDPIDRISSRPDFMILCYPVISFITPYVHRGSVRN